MSEKAMTQNEFNTAKAATKHLLQETKSYKMEILFAAYVKATANSKRIPKMSASDFYDFVEREFPEYMDKIVDAAF